MAIAERDTRVDYNFHIRPILSDRCFACHGPDANTRESDLRLDTPEGAYAALKDDPTAHVIVAGDPAASAVYQRITSTDSSLIMPPPDSKLSLNKEEIALISRWIEQGAEYKKHWSFLAPEKSSVLVSDDSWCQNDIDRFVLAQMTPQGLQPNPRASNAALLKRVYLDLIGLLPTVEEQEAFLADDSPDAFEKVVDQLLDNPHYGEKMAIAWLDLARYADSHGYQDDGLRTMWPWRDWVIHAFNQNYPYDQFVTWQLAGDLLPSPNKETLLATGFNRNHKITQEGGVIDEEYRIEYVTDRTNTFGKGLLALTFECAKCHTHKYDPISHEDYYSTFAFFNQVPEKGLYGTIDFAFADPPNMSITQEDVNSILSFVNKQDTMPLQVMVMKDSSVRRPTYILDRGVYDAKTEEVTFDLPSSILEYDTTRYAPNRLGLAKWLTDDANPLTARVYVNRIWEQFFGRGIVRTTGDFGMQGEIPSHPELLDWLAVDFRKNGWNIKRLVKQIVMSSTYQQSSEVREQHLQVDPENTYLARSSRLRLPAELLRDMVLYTGGILNPEIGGPSIKPYQPDGVWESASSGRGTLKTYIQDHGDDLYRRGLYVFIKRTVPPPSMLVFDANNRDQCEVDRMRTSTPLQSLIMMNDPTILEAARVLAEDLSRSTMSQEERIRYAFRKIICRKITKEEFQILNTYFQEELDTLSQDEEKAYNLLSVGEYPCDIYQDTHTKAALMNTVLLIYNMEEAIVKV